MRCPNKDVSCFCTGECVKDFASSSSKAYEFVNTKATFHSGQKIFNLKGNVKHTCEFLCYDPSDEEFCYVRYSTYNVQRVALENIQSK